MTPTRPSIMSDGSDDIRPRCGQRNGRAGNQAQGWRSFSISYSSPLLFTMPQWPCEVYSQRQTSAISSSFLAAGLRARRACCTIPFVRVGPAGLFVFNRWKPEEQQAAQAELRAASSTSFIASSMDRLIDPGHGADLAPDAFAGADEEGVDQGCRGEDELRGPASASPRCAADAADG